jgi:hypothetical protein
MSQFACARRNAAHEHGDAGFPLDAAALLLDAGPPVPQRGMAWIEPGPLVVGTPPNTFPRRPDRDLPGEQVMLHGFYIDDFAYPNEEGAIPTTNVTQSEARALCAKQGKRLCSELEWERACKGPQQHVFEYGDAYREETCGTGMPVVAKPSGFRVGCRSDFGVHDLHGGVFEWTDSRWLRGVGSSAQGSLVVVRGGNDALGELIGRCANAEPRAAESKASTTGFRCCLGPVNEVEVTLRVDRGEAMSSASPIDSQTLQRMLEHAPAAVVAELKDYKWDGMAAYVWRPLGNERLTALSVCARKARPQVCGILIGRDTPGAPMVLGFAGTGYFPSKLYVDVAPEDVWVLGNDASGAFRRLIQYNWGSVTVGPKQRRLSRAETDTRRKKHKRRGASK